MSETELDKLKVLLISQNRNINVIKCPIEENKVKISKKYEPFFESESTFQIKEISTFPLFGRLITKRRKREACILQIYGKQHAEKLPKSNKKDLFEPLTNLERKDIVKRQIALALGEIKPMSTIMFIILAMLIITNVILAIMQLKGVRI